MTDKRTFIKGTIASAVALGLGSAASSTMAGKPGFEKCQGIAAKGMNDCGTSTHACAGQAKADSDPEEWVYVPEGTCKKIAGGKVKMAKK